MRSLLDVNVLVAILDPQHVRHRDAKLWLAANEVSGWATCPITENGCVRVLCQTAYPQGGYKVAQVMERLEQLIGIGRHQFWPDDVSLLNKTVADRKKLQGPGQLTDAYLLALAVRHAGRLVTFDSGIALSTIPKAKSENLIRIPIGS